MSNVFVVDQNRVPLNPVSPGRARILLTGGKAAVLKRCPFTIILKRQVSTPQTKPLRIKLDPGSKTTGLAIVNDASGSVVFAAEVQHRGERIRKRLTERRAIRRNRRQRRTRYRKPRFDNRRNKKQSWLPPSLESRLANVLTWVNRLRKLCPIRALSVELVKFDMQLMENPEIAGVAYQQGTLAGYELREYLLEKWKRQCAYCDAKNVPLQVEHMLSRAKGGSNRVSNLSLACEPCNSKKGTQDIREFLAHKPDVLKRVVAQAKAPLKDAAAVNATRWALYARLKATGLPIECGSGGLTKYNRTLRGLPKEHWLDAICVGKSTPERLAVQGIVPWLITAKGYGNRQMCGINDLGFPTRHRQRKKVHYGFQTGEMVRAVVPSGKKAGVHVGRVLVRATGSFDITTRAGRIQGISSRYCQPIHRMDGYSYQHGKKGTRHSSPA